MKSKQPPPRHPLDIFDVREDGKIYARPVQSPEDFDRWYDDRYGLGVPGWLVLLAILAFCGMMFTLGYIHTTHPQQRPVIGGQTDEQK